MIFSKEFIWYDDHFVYHITEKSNLDEIRKVGLKPFCGERSKSVDETRNAIYFFDNLFSTENWIDELYKNKDKTSLELLRFNLKRRKWYIQNQMIGDFYLLRPVLPEKIELLKRTDEKNIIHPLTDIVYQKKLIWEPLKNKSK